MKAEVEGGIVSAVTGQSCKRGEDYARKEVTNPRRIVTSTVPLLGGYPAVLPVKTAGDIPKDKIFACMRELKSIKLTAPIKTGDVVVKNIAGTGVDVVATRGQLLSMSN
jgi:CxxC motif-containing protein